MLIKYKTQLVKALFQKQFQFSDFVNISRNYIHNLFLSIKLGKNKIVL